MHRTGPRPLLKYPCRFTPFAAALAAASCMTACAGSPDIEPWKYTAPVESATELGPLDFMDVVKARDGGFSVGWRGRSVWVFGDTILASAGEDGSAWRSSTWCSTQDMDASDGLSNLVEPVDSLGAPYEFLPFTAQEKTFNDAHRGDECMAAEDCGDRYALWPGPIVVMPDDSAVVMYTKLSAGPGAFNFSVLGCGIAGWNDPDEPVTRLPAIGGPPDDPLMLTGTDEPCLTAAALVHEGYLYAYAVQDAWMAHPCIVGRAPITDMLKRDAWLFYAGDDKWVTDWRDAKTVIDGSTMMSIHFNAHLDRFVAIHNAIISGEVVIQVADNPWGPWSTSTVMFTGLEPTLADSWDYSGLAHAELSEDNGKIEYITYYRPGDWTGEMRLVKVTFE